MSCRGFRASVFTPSVILKQYRWRPSWYYYTASRSCYKRPHHVFPSHYTYLIHHTPRSVRWLSRPLTNSSCAYNVGPLNGRGVLWKCDLSLLVHSAARCGYSDRQKGTSPGLSRTELYAATVVRIAVRHYGHYLRSLLEI